MEIVIGGAQRSGTSLLRSIVGSHSRVAMFPYDLRLWTYFGPRHSGQNLTLEKAETLLRAILSDKKALMAEDLPTFDEVQDMLLQAGSEGLSANHVFDCFLKAYASRRGKPWWGLKTPWNEFYAGEIMENLANVVFLHIMRNPLNSAASAKHVEGGSWFYDPFSHIDRWRRSAHESRQNAEHYPGRYHVLRYEDLVADPAGTTRNLCNQIGLDYEEGMELGLKQPGWSGSNSSFAESAGSPRPPKKRTIPLYLRSVYNYELAEEMRALNYEENSSFRKPNPLHLLFSGCHKIWLAIIYSLIRLKKSISDPRARAG